MLSKILSKLPFRSPSPAHTTAASHQNASHAGRDGEKSDAQQKTKKRRNRGGRNKNQEKQAVAKTAVQSWDVGQFVVEAVEGKARFHDFDLPDALMHAIADLGFSYCSPIQAQSLPYTLRGGDIVGKAQTGTGKTAAFLISVINDLLKNPLEHERYAGEARAIVLAPTRELAIQIGKDAEALCKYSGLSVQVLVGGMDYQKQKNHLHAKLVDILVATPGRLIDFMESRDVHLDEVECLVIDEADRMLDMGFIPQVKRIVRATPMKENRQTLLFSATFNQDVLNLAKQWTCDPIHIEIQPERAATDNVEQRIYMMSSDEKFTVLMNLLQGDDVQSLIVFANRRDICRDLFEKLRACNVSCGILSGEVDQDKRIRTLEKFRSGQTKVLVATDVAGRGIHVDGISHVINYTLPEVADDYVHRIGRTGRAGAKGISISFASEDDSFLLPAIEQLLGQKLQCEMAPVELMKKLSEDMQFRADKAERESRRDRRAASANKSGGRSSSHRPRR